MSTFRRELVQDMYVLSPMQEGMLFHSLLNGDNNSHLVQMTIHIQGKIDVELFSKSLQMLVSRYDVFRTTFLHEKMKKPVQVVLKERPISIQFYNMSSFDERKKNEQAEQYKRKDQEATFDITKDPLMRVIILQMNADEYQIIWSFHHIIMDGWCFSIIFDELIQMYYSLVENQPLLLKPVQAYSTFIKWLEKQDQEASLQYWTKYMKDYEHQAVLQKDGATNEKMEFLPKQYHFSFDRTLTQQLQQIAQNNQVTLPIIFQTIWGLALQKYNSSNDVIFGSVVSGRPSELLGIERMVGLFINTLPLRIHTKTDQSFSEVVKAVHQGTLSSQQYEHVPLYEIQNHSELKQDLFDHIVVIENYPLVEELKKNSVMQKVGFSVLSVEMFEPTNYDLTIMVQPREEIHVRLDYNAAVFTTALMKRIEGHLKQIAVCVANNPNAALKDITMLTQEEYHHVVVELNDTKTEYPDKTIHELFVEQVEKTPDHIAVVLENKHLTYRQLDAKSNQLARFLRNKGIGPDRLVGLMMDRSIEMIIGILGILKSGGAFVPIDPAYPAERISYMLENSDVQILLTQQHLMHKNPSPIEIVDIQDSSIMLESMDHVANQNTSNDLFYIIYTSGTTGKPKGVMLEHKNMVNLMQFTFAKTNIQYKEKVLQYTTCSFDVCYQEIFSTLLSGGELYLITDDTRRNVEKLFTFIEREKISILSLPGAFLKFIFNDASFSKIFPTCVKHIITAGEQLVVTHELKRYLQNNQVYLHNHYGPSETHVVTTFTIDPNNEIPEIPSIGKPISNTSIYILDKEQKLQPHGIAGELFISGANVGRGYIYNAEMTAEKFSTNPFIANERMYRTGDLARWLPDGTIEYLGRIDHQVKIRGHRIELGEIESHLLNHKDIKEAVVIDRIDENQTRHLVAYIVQSKEVSDIDLRNYMGKTLPDYMVPSFFVSLEQIPLTPNGKIDRRSLPKPEGTIGTGVAYVAPATELEQKLATIWQGVLGVPKIGIHDHFFSLGGHSLKAMSLISLIQKEFGVDIPLRILFKTPTIQAIAKYLESGGGDVDETYASIPTVPTKEFYPVSSAQKRMIILHQLAKEGTGYNIPTVMVIDGPLQYDRFELAVERLVDRHEILRTSFPTVNGESVQRVNQNVNIKINYLDSKEEQVDQVIEEFIQPFILESAPLIRIGLVKVSTERHYLLVDMHHVISDGVSANIFINELTKFYQAETLPELRIQYKDFAVWEQEFFQSEAFKKQEEYWVSAFSGEVTLLNLPTDYPRPTIQSFEGDRYTFGMEKDLVDGLYRIAKETQTTLYMVLLAIYNVLLSKYSDQEEVIIGTPIAGRSHADTENLLGMFVNTLAMRNQPVGNKTFTEFLTDVKNNALLAFEHADYPFEHLVEKMKLPRDLSRNPLFDTMFILQNTEHNSFELDEIKCTPFVPKGKHAKFDFSLEASEEKNELKFCLEYSTSLYRQETIERMASHWLQIIRTVVENSDISLSEIDILTEAEKQQVIKEFNDTQAEFSSDQTIQQLFEHQVKRRPDEVAVVFEQDQLTYQELNEKANQLARLLRQKGVLPNQLVGIMVERSLDMVIGTLAILKSGAAFLPIDPEYPEDRIRYMIEDSQAKWVVAQPHLMDKVECDAEYINVSDHILSGIASTNLLPNSQSTDLAYVIYTSGTTGKPKGVMLEHTGITNLKVFFENSFGISEQDCIGQFASNSFDASVWEMFMALVTGARLTIISKEKITDFMRFENYVSKQGVTVLTLPPTYVIHLDPERLPTLRTLITAGSATSFGLVDKWKDKVTYINAYGPTETSICATYWKAEEESRGTSVPIGIPIQNAQVYIVDHSLQLQGIGEVGEMCVGGVGLARGYWNRPELTAEKFVDNPFVPDEKIYRTGDLARWLPDGNIEYLGRIDHQVKIRGHRVELGEIESLLLQHPGIKEAAVLAREDYQGQSYLCAYMVSDKNLSVSEVREYVANELPNYMIPSYFVELDKMPLTPNDKIDRKALPEPDKNQDTGKAYDAPRNKLEQSLAEIWQVVLGIEKIGIKDNFFELGGDSLKAMSVITQVHKAFQIELPLKVLFEAQIIETLSEYITLSDKKFYTPIPTVPQQEYYPVSSAQKRMYILHQLEGAGISYNMPGMMVIEGALDKDRFKQALQEVINRHESLRTSYRVVQEQIVQSIQEHVEFDMGYMQAQEQGLNEIFHSFVRPFDLAVSPLCRSSLVKLEAERHVFLFDVHHIASDGTSIGIILKEVADIYEGKKLPQLPISYKDFSAWQNEMFLTDAIKKQEEYWLNLFTGEIPVANLPTDYPRPAVQSFDGDQFMMRTGKEIFDGLQRVAVEAGTTRYMVLLAAYNVLLSKYSDQEDIIVGAPIAGRSHADLENVVGMFVNTLAMRNKPVGNITFKDFLKEVKQNALQAYENQDYPFEELVEKLQLERDPSRNPLFDTMFILQNGVVESRDFDQLVMRPYEQGDSLGVSKFDMAFHMTEGQEEILFRIEYGTKLFTRATIERIAGHFLKIIRTIIANTEVTLSKIDMLTETEKQLLLVRFNDNTAEFSSDQTIHQLFEEQVENHPHEIAVVYEQSQLTYQELNAKANQLARLLREKGVQPNQLVGIMVERSLDMVIGTLAILKSGAAFLPIDPEYPEDRIRYMIEDSQTRWVLVQSHLMNSVDSDAEFINVSTELPATIATTNLISISQPADLAYVIYTSGTTGRPKGVMLEHTGIANLKTFFEDKFGVSEEDHIGQFASQSFDASVWEMFMALLTGARLDIISRDTINDFVKFEEYINQQRITVLTLPPTYVIHLEPEHLSTLRILITAGSATSVGLVNKWKDKVTYINGYGPTETSICATYWKASVEQSISQSVPIGVPIQNAQVYILDQRHQLQGIGEVGELCVAGVGLARGYLNRPELSAEKFVENPFIPGQKMYKTGDLARWLPDGTIEYLGRADHQVKIRGHRVELGEIESLLLQHHQINEAAVLAREDEQGHSYLCAYLVSEEALSVAEIRGYLTDELPNYMIPSYFVQLDIMPLTPNDKIDRKALPEPDKNQNTGKEYDAPRNDLEQLVTEIWQDVLGIEKIGIRDNFFELGGDSIKAIQVLTRLTTAGWKLEMKDLFQNPAIEHVIPYVTPSNKMSNQGVVEGEIELTPIQSWFFTSQFTDMHQWNQAVMLHGENGFDEEAVALAFQKIIEHHDALRMVYRRKDDKIIQWNRGIENTLFDLYKFDLKEEVNLEDKILELSNDIQSSIDLAEGPLVKLAIFQTSKGDYLLIAIHHLVIDGVSWRILFEDFSTAYSQALSNQEITLPDKTDSFKDWSIQMQKYANSESSIKEIEYWEKLEKTARVMMLPRDFEEAENQQKNTRILKTELTIEQTENLLRNVNHSYHTEVNDILLTAVGLAFKDWAKTNQLIINLEGHGREDIMNDMNISRTVGWFTSQYPVVLDLDNSEDISLQIKQVKENLRHIPNKGVGYDILRYLTIKELRPSLSFGLQPEVSFNYLGQFDSDVKTGVFTLSQTNTGNLFSPDSERPFLLDISSVVEGRKLQISIGYNSLQYKEETIATLAETYKKHLLLVIEHCMSKEGAELTPSDLGDDDLSFEDLENILELI
ncbi:non-ribosomal peptide synthetase [Brevibacillus laterosporus]|uniref:non-ribosomal peptide synthetase n=1 Tax=Brevibacillus laterosporus TaxID=1465 RepID=UPI001EF22569|nr:non-ribosomal peptide synthetase [Brevibacillus laterosporus]MCG7317691.1 amino acid adenylation domain-containing protein [Brevibacillus laterosporus]